MAFMALNTENGIILQTLILAVHISYVSTRPINFFLRFSIRAFVFHITLLFHAVRLRILIFNNYKCYTFFSP